MDKAGKTFALWLLLIALFFVYYWVFSRQEPPQTSRPRSQLELDLKDDHVESVAPGNGVLRVRDGNGNEYSVRGSLDAALVKDLVAHGVRLDWSARKPAFDWSALLGWVIPVLLIVVVFVFVLRRFSGGQNIFAIRKTTARLVSRPPEVKFDDVGGATEAKERLADVLDYLRRPRAWQAAGARLPRGVLLEGPPGCGKTLLARALAGEAKVPFFEVSASEFVELFVGVGAARVRDVFEQAAKKAPAVIFIDELDAVGRRRGAGAISAGHQEREQTLNQLLVSLDGFQRRSGVVVVAATNRADILDPALLRPGRFDLHVKVGALSEGDRAEVLRIHSRGKPLELVDFAALARRTPGYSGAELEHLVNEAAIHAVRRQREGTVTIVPQDFDAVLDAEARRRSEFDALDALLIEAGTQLAQPSGKVTVAASLGDGTEETGDVLWADEHFLKLRRPDGTTVSVTRANIVRLEPQGDLASVRADALRDDLWARVKPESV